MIGLEAAATAIIEVLTRTGGLGIHFSTKVESLKIS
jgi:ribosomal protein S28E/S33